MLIVKCQDVVNQASNYLDEEMSPFERFSMKLHLIVCLKCRRFLRHLGLASAVSAEIARNDTLDPQQDAELVDRIMAHIQQHGGLNR